MARQIVLTKSQMLAVARTSLLANAALASDKYAMTYHERWQQSLELLLTTDLYPMDYLSLASGLMPMARRVLSSCLRL